MLIGIIKWFNPLEGFGIVENPDEGEFFLHINNFLIRPDNISKGTPIVFNKRIDQKKNRKVAEDCHFWGETGDWELIMDYLDKPDNVSIEVMVTGRGKRGNPYHYNEMRSFSLKELAIKQFVNGKSESELSGIITEYYDSDLNSKKFIPYCNLIEKIINNELEGERAKSILDNIYTYFRNNLNEEILFYTWKSKQFKFISYIDTDEYEIPESILKNYSSEISPVELERIIKYDFGLQFCTDFLASKFKDLNELDTNELEELYAFFKFIDEEDREKQKLNLDKQYSERIIVELREKANQLELIKNQDDFNNYNLLKKLVFNQVNQETQNKIFKDIDKIIAERCSDDFKSELWIKGVIDDSPFELILKTFCDTQTQNDKRITILKKLSGDKQVELLKAYSINGNWINAFNFLESLLKKENTLGYDFKISDKLFESNFWKGKKFYDLVSTYSQYVNDSTTELEKFELFLKGLIKDVPVNLVHQNINDINEDKIRKICSNQIENRNFILEILIAKIALSEISDIEWIYDLGNRFLDSSRFKKLDQNVNRTINQLDYFKLWEKGKAKIFPSGHIKELLTEYFESYREIDKWIASNLITKDKVCDFLLKDLYELTPVTDRIIFYRQFNHVKYLLYADELYIDKIQAIKNDFYKIILWFFDKENTLNFDLLKQKFIYFSPNDQIRIIRKLFSLKVKGDFDFSIEKLNELTRIDLDLYKINLNFNPTISLDISSDVVIKALVSYSQKKKFLVETELLSVILNDLKDDKTRRFKLESYFENCRGREIANLGMHNGVIGKVKYGDDKYYFAISFPTGELKSIYHGSRRREEYKPNPEFEKLKDAVKKLPGSRWNQNGTHWGVPSQNESDVMIFAKEHRFRLYFGGKNYSNNTHLVEFKRAEVPNGISFCEGRLANKIDETYKKNFWWCTGLECYEKCETIHTPDQWENYTLLDFCEILGLNTDEINHKGDFVPKGHYYQFIGLINRFNQLLEKLYCQDCKEILYPIDTSNFAAYAVVRFQCVNSNCSNREEVYLNHCLNGKCKTIIDSRISKKCSNGLYICDNCGSCCSHEMFKRRLSNLQLNGGYIHGDLKRCVDEKLGHLERAEYFCYKCKNKMNESSENIFHCNQCNVTYDTTKYNFKRPHKQLRSPRISDY